jgi:hypothetical protein
MLSTGPHQPRVTYMVFDVLGLKGSLLASPLAAGRPLLKSARPQLLLLATPDVFLSGLDSGAG